MEITAIIPCFNGARFIRRALDSVVAQTTPVSEIVVVDDGSTDNSVEIISQWLADNPGAALTLISQKNAGVSSARNTAVRRSISEWCALLDADDLWYPRHNEALLEAAGERWSFVFGDADRTDGSVMPSVFEKASISGDTLTLGSDLHKKLIRSSYVSTCSSLFRRSAFEAIGGFEDGRAFGEDRKFWLRLLTAGDARILQASLGCQTYHDGNATRGENDLKRLRANVSLAEEICQHPADFGLDEGSLEYARQCRDGAKQELLYHLRTLVDRATLGSVAWCWKITKSCRSWRSNQSAKPR